MRTVTNVLEKLTTFATIVGVISFFWKFDSHITVLYCCAGISFLHSVLNVTFGDQNNLVTEGYTLAAGAIVAYVFKLPLLPMLALFICIGEVYFTIIAILSFVCFVVDIRKKR